VKIVKVSLPALFAQEYTFISLIFKSWFHFNVDGY